QARSLRTARQSKTQRVPLNKRERLMDPVRRHRANNLGLNQKSRGIGPVECRYLYRPNRPRYFGGFQSCERARTGNTRNPNIAKLVALAGVDRNWTDSRLAPCTGATRPRNSSG